MWISFFIFQESLVKIRKETLVGDVKFFYGNGTNSLKKI